MRNDFKRSNEPIFWGLFGAGGMMSAVFAPAVILVLLLLPAFGLEAGRNFYTVVFGGIIGRLFMLAMIVLPLWCGLHRIHHCLHDLKIHSPVVKLFCYGAALILSVLTVYLIFIR